jgi:hypothetical protein
MFLLGDGRDLFDPFFSLESLAAALTLKPRPVKRKDAPFEADAVVVPCGEETGLGVSFGSPKFGITVTEKARVSRRGGQGARLGGAKKKVAGVMLQRTNPLQQPVYHAVRPGTWGETLPVHASFKKRREWSLGRLKETTRLLVAASRDYYARHPRRTGTTSPDPREKDPLLAGVGPIDRPIIDEIERINRNPLLAPITSCSGTHGGDRLAYVGVKFRDSETRDRYMRRLTKAGFRVGRPADGRPEIYLLRRAKGLTNERIWREWAAALGCKRRRAGHT